MSGRTGGALELPGAFRRFPQRSASSQYRRSFTRIAGCGNPCAAALRCTFFDEAKWTASIKDYSVFNVAGIHRCACWNRGEAGSNKRPRKSRELSLTSGTARNLRLLKNVVGLPRKRRRK